MAEPYASRPAAGNPRSGGDATTLASIIAAPTNDFFAPTVTGLPANAVQIENLTEFSYSYDVLQMGDPFTATVPDPRGLYRDQLLPGWFCRFYLSSPAVRGGAPTLKVTGIITDRRAGSDNRGGTAIRVTGADLGWHLIHNDAPLWMNLRGVTFVQLCIFDYATHCSVHSTLL